MARSFLLTWNPKKWAWRELQSAIEQIDTAGIAFEPWSVGNRMDLPVGSRVFLMRLGAPPRGLVGSGWTTTLPKNGPHWDPEKREAGAETPSVGVEFDVLAEVPLIKAEELELPPFDQLSSWTPQSSGVELPAVVSDALNALWEARVSPASGAHPSAVLPEMPFVEGSCKRILVNSYERDPRARRRCIEHHGARCTICDFSFAAVYGQDFTGFIHVHHLKPISTLGEDYRLDPVADLRPVCPNCHAALHHRRVPYSIEELRACIANQESA
ncbi:MAG: HNH endonuclease [Nitrospira sp.]|nr:HNH endonuclease [Nitrospira sp.]MBH0181748.1 HNH endonuclease [Nitrospira sp.]MBH0184370.1 HNH endonuclease [Nitrospira sp.]